MLEAAKLFRENCSSISMYFECAIDSLFLNHFKNIPCIPCTSTRYATQFKMIDRFWMTLDTNMEFYFCFKLNFSNEEFCFGSNYLAFLKFKCLSRLFRYTFPSEDCHKTRPYWASHGKMVRLSFQFFWVLY